MKKIYLVAFLLTGITLGCVLGLRQADAADLSQFQPGRIIDDAIFTDSGSMSAAQIQDFLVQKNSACLKDFRSLSIHDDNGDGIVQDSSSEQYGPGTMSAAELIAEAAKIYRINPKVLLVTLQKEQGLVTRTDCPDWRYNTALGYGCPDTAPCDQSAFGFTRQIDYGSYHFRGYYDDSLPSVPYGTGNQTIYFNPNASCGSSVVNIQNRATAALYNYTPYQPNTASLAAGYGTAEPCGAYGNRNFYQYFTDWFGSTLAPNYSWQLTSQYAFTSDAKTVAIGLNDLSPGQRAYIGFTAKNTGNMTWSNSGPNPVRVGTLREAGRSSQFYDPSWLGYGRPATLKETSVAPGEIGTFEFWITTPSSSTPSYKEYFGILSESRAWMPDIGMHYSIGVQPARYGWDLVNQYAYTDETKTTGIGLHNLEPGQRRYVGLVIKNTGNITWKNSGVNPLNLGTTRPTDRSSPYYDPSWLGYGRPATLKETSVAPGETGTFEFWIKTPINRSGNFWEYFSPLIEGKTWLNDIGLNYSGSVIEPLYTWSLTSQYAYTDDSKSTPIGLGNLTPGQTVYVGFTAVNTGNITWLNSGTYPVRVGTSPHERTSPACDARWLSCTRPSALKEPSVVPGQTGTFEFWIKAPNTPGEYREYFNLVSESRAWMKSINFNYSLRVN